MLNNEIDGPITCANEQNLFMLSNQNINIRVDVTMPDPVSRMRLKKKVIDRWENEGGKLCDDLSKPPTSSPSRKREIKVPKLSREITAGNDNPSARKDKPIKEQIPSKT